MPSAPSAAIRARLTRALFIAQLAVVSRANAGGNPDAVYRDPMTVDDYLGDLQGNSGGLRQMYSKVRGGVLERLPQLRIAFAHGGGAFPGTLGRIEHGVYS